MIYVMLPAFLLTEYFCIFIEVAKSVSSLFWQAMEVIPTVA